MNRIYLFTSCIFLAGMFLILPACKREDSVPAINKPDWLRVLSDTIFSSTDDEIYQGRNGKILSDSSDNLYLYIIKAVQPGRCDEVRFKRKSRLEDVFS
jgi:hypothetical protein